ncbi:N-6 DNA methylase [Rhizobium herbae]|uniref:site-specific DNA-methyltransferase (adenine-specific) n=1 Tax=Rhizobium herbae TaxID=508661 RepID=A0ABS4EKI8_9HYPH|nr:N-6 DNA methylase [Rhizobium herbae]MBP1858460.1 hypothetical protein [Rhizobium herbae]
MTIGAQQPFLGTWLAALGYSGTGDALLTSMDQIGRRPYATELRDLLDPTGEYRCAAVFVVEDTPTICFSDVEQMPARRDVDAVRQRLWNQNLVSALLVCSEEKLTAFAIPKQSDVPEQDALAFSDVRDDGPWSVPDVRSSQVQQRLSEWFDPNLRVDRRLLRQLADAVLKLSGGKKPLMASDMGAKMLLAQVMFISYLEHRGVVGDDYRKVHSVGSLHELIRSSDGAGIDALIRQLKYDFNGDFLEPADVRWSELNLGVLDIVDKFLSRVDLRTGQQDFWNYDFSQIPVELLSGIYEIFLESDRDADGAFYTPRVLAELAIQQAFDGYESVKHLRIFDGACGSGILLTTAFRRVVSYEEADRRRTLTIQERISLLQATIFGGDINPIACRVTAFSLYLCLLEKLAPADLAVLQKDENCKLPQLIGANIVHGREGGDFFASANKFSSSRSFDIIISNPPWRELKQGEGTAAIDWSVTRRVHLPHRQIAAAYAMKCAEAAKPGGRIVVILPTSLITAPSNDVFLKQATVHLSLERLVNLSDFRRILFAQAEHACTIMRARNEPGLRDKRIEGTFEYWTPKADISFAFNRLTLHDYDRVVLSRESLVAGNGELRRRFWGNRRDNSLYYRLLNLRSLGDTVKERGWLIAKGYHMKDGLKKADPTVLQEYRYLATDALNSDSPLVNTGALQDLPVNRGVASHGNLALYEGHRVLWSDGTSVQMGIRAAYTSDRFCFPSGVGGIRVNDGDAALAKFLTCYLRSSLAQYWLILTGYTAQTERARVTLGDIKALPLPLSRLDVSETELDSLLSELARAVEREDRKAVTGTRELIDGLVFDIFGLSENERAIVLDMVQLSGESLQPTSYGELLTPLQKAPRPADVAAYAHRLAASLNQFVKNMSGAGTISAKILARGDRAPLDVVHVALVAEGHGMTTGMRRDQDARNILIEISNRISSGSPIDFFAMPNSIFVLGNDIYIIKPRRMRFWTQSAALRDADEMVTCLSPKKLKSSGVSQH